ncbi:MAG TPA: hypothetical protein VFZ22_18235 [Pyrinomonadaceae bacterium]|nr:hypothetical protein [Pyrinomonadaceae bacterium]
MLQVEPAVEATKTIHLIGAGAFGAVVGWYVYYINRWRKDDVQLSDIVTLLGAIGGAAVLALFPAKSDLFGAYGIGLASGFFLYFFVLVVLVNKAPGFTSAWFLDGRAPALSDKEITTTGHAMSLKDKNES